MNEIFATLKLPYCEGCNHRNTIPNIKESNAYTLSESFSKPYLHSIEGARRNVVKLTNNLIDCVVTLHFKYISHCSRQNR